MASKNPPRANVCIVGAGASGATAAKVLTEAGVDVVMLDRGPWKRDGEFSGDELANVSRHFLTQDPLLDPRTLRGSDDEEAAPQVFIPIPQMVGGGTAHWTGWCLRMLESDFTPRSLHGDIPGASLADWPITYEELEPYYDRVEWSLGVAGIAGANRFEAPRSRDYPMPPIPNTRYAKAFHDGCKALGYNSFPTPMAMLSQPYNGRATSVQSAFVQQFGDPSGTSSTILTTYIPDAIATGKLDLRPDCRVREITVDKQGRAKSVIYEDEHGDTVEQDADVILLACGAIESARLLLLSKSTLFPDGLANSSGLVGRNLTLHEYTAAVGVFDDAHEPIYGWAGGGYISGSTYEFYETDTDRGFISGGHVAASGLGIPLPINFALPDRPAWGQRAKDLDRQYFNRSMAVGIVIHDLPQERNRVELDDRVTDSAGLPVARITHTPHPNDLAQGQWIVDRNAEILEAAGASQVWRRYVERFTGNAHQHGTCRMGDDADGSVLNKWCQAHDVNNLFVIDSSPFPTSTGSNPTLTIMANAWRVADHILNATESVASRRQGPL
jgi:choline dehydrogenase-like flavoprotein